MQIALATAIVLNVISGAANTLVASGMNRISAPTAPGKTEQFSHPFVQTMVMMMGEASCLVVFALLYWRATNRAASDPSPWHLRQLLFVIPSSLDWCATSMLYASMLDLPGSQVQMLRGSLVIFVFLISVFVLRNKVYKHHYLGVLLVMFGVTCVGFSAMLSPEAENEVDDASERVRNPFRGVVTCLSAQIIAASLMTSEEKLFRKLQTPAILAVGVEGCCGLVIGVVALTLTGLAGIESPGKAGYQISHSGLLFTTCVLLCASIATFNCTGAKITKTTSATARSTVDGLRTMLVWVGDMTLGWASTDYRLFAFWLQPIGFTVTMIGTLIYFNIITLPSLTASDELESEERERPLMELEEQSRNSSMTTVTVASDQEMSDIEVG